MMVPVCQVYAAKSTGAGIRVVEREQLSSFGGYLPVGEKENTPHMVYAEAEYFAKLRPTEELAQSGYYGILDPKPRTEYNKYYYYNKALTTDDELRDHVGIALESCSKSIGFLFKGDFYKDWEDRFLEITFSSGAFGNHINWFNYHAEYNKYTDTSMLSFVPVYKESWKAVSYLRYNGYPVDDSVKELLSAAQKIVDDAVTYSSDLTVQILYINNRICDMARYDHAAFNRNVQLNEGCIYTVDRENKVVPAHDATGVLLNGKGVCESYAAAFELCMNILGVPNYMVTSLDNEHCWNRVKIDGQWLNIDVTWNDAESGLKNEYFILNDFDLLEKTKKNGGKLSNHLLLDKNIPNSL